MTAQILGTHLCTKKPVRVLTAAVRGADSEEEQSAKGNQWSVQYELADATKSSRFQFQLTRSCHFRDITEFMKMYGPISKVDHILVRDVT